MANPRFTIGRLMIAIAIIAGFCALTRAVGPVGGLALPASLGAGLGAGVVGLSRVSTSDVGGPPGRGLVAAIFGPKPGLMYLVWVYPRLPEPRSPGSTKVVKRGPPSGILF